MGLTQSIPVGVGTVLIARRPDVRAVERRLAASTARIGVATADLYLTIDVGTPVTSVEASLSTLGVAASRIWSVGPLAMWLARRWTVAKAGRRMDYDQVSATPGRRSVRRSHGMAWVGYRPTVTIAACRLD